MDHRTPTRGHREPVADKQSPPAGRHRHDKARGLQRRGLGWPSFFCGPAALLAQARAAEADTDVQAIWWNLGYVFAAVVVLVIVVLAVRKWLSGGADEPQMPTGFALSDLRQLYADGHLTQEEFETAKAKLIGRHREAMAEAAEGESEKNSDHSSDNERQDDSQSPPDRQP